MRNLASAWKSGFQSYLESNKRKTMIQAEWRKAIGAQQGGYNSISRVARLNALTPYPRVINQFDGWHHKYPPKSQLFVCACKWHTKWTFQHLKTITVLNFLGFNRGCFRDADDRRADADTGIIKGVTAHTNNHYCHQCHSVCLLPLKRGRAWAMRIRITGNLSSHDIMNEVE